MPPVNLEALSLRQHQSGLHAIADLNEDSKTLAIPTSDIPNFNCCILELLNDKRLLVLPELCLSELKSWEQPGSCGHTPVLPTFVR